uniref:Uncharacterized protein n=1 Tax=Anas platyrhynchos TaxID=8839 RepID=A0A8B9T9N1_ANAPL
MAGVDDRSRAPKLLVLVLDLPLGKGPCAMCSAFLPYCVVCMYVFIYFSEGKGGFFMGLSVRVSNQATVNTRKRVGCSASWTASECYSASSGEPGEGAQDRRKVLSREMEKELIIPLPHPVRPEDTE